MKDETLYCFWCDEDRPLAQFSEKTLATQAFVKIAAEAGSLDSAPKPKCKRCVSARVKHVSSNGDTHIFTIGDLER